MASVFELGFERVGFVEFESGFVTGVAVFFGLPKGPLEDHSSSSKF